MAKVFTPAVIERLIQDGENRLDGMDKGKGKRPNIRNRRIANRMASQLILFWKDDRTFQAMAKDAGKK